ncbi:hypothetical protein CROQUDRAFT_89251 [Cronartium quercuum f. sp. fusiforme G11]|uniref:Uncharacterized protein n=1 Tax=Cronartium quercuum f. sp. fusiforme G11 TaxID=708437 RepID=A0A9P6TG56_9BASI|nr:hypothetical protein CROQUDRAFT_89251 [Cronartium quercuum f. sp. fusiforme G11]
MTPHVKTTQTDRSVAPEVTPKWGGFTGHVGRDWSWSPWAAPARPVEAMWAFGSPDGQPRLVRGLTTLLVSKGPTARSFLVPGIGPAPTETKRATSKGGLFGCKFTPNLRNRAKILTLRQIANFRKLFGCGKISESFLNSGDWKTKDDIQENRALVFRSLEDIGEGPPASAAQGAATGKTSQCVAHWTPEPFLNGRRPRKNQPQFLPRLSALPPCTTLLSPQAGGRQMAHRLRPQPSSPVLLLPHHSAYQAGGGAQHDERVHRKTPL